MQEKRKPFQYQILSKEIANKIKNKLYKPGEKLPSTRELHKKLNLSINTVYKAFIELEKQGLIEARPKSGYYVCIAAASLLGNPGETLNSEQQLPVPIEKKSSRSIPVAQLSFVNQVLKAVNHPDYLHLGTAMIAPEFLPTRQFKKIIAEIPQKDIGAILSYNLTQGDPHLRRQLSLRSLGILPEIEAEDFIITNGCTEAISLSLQAITKPGDTIGIESPTFYGFLPVLEVLKLKAIEIPTDPVSGVDVNALEQILRTQKIDVCLLTPNFNDPLGALLSEKNKKKLVELLNAHHIPIIEDNINAELFFGKQRPIPLKAFDQNNEVIFCSSFSKTLAPGLRVGWMLPGKKYFEKILNLKAGISVSTSSLDQYMLTRFMEQGTYERYLRSLRTLLKKQIVQFVDAINTHFPKESKVTLPEGGLLLWIQLPQTVDSMMVYQQALEKQISILPGSIFSVSSQFNHYIRIGCGFPFNQQTEKGLAILGSIIKENM